MSSPTETSVIPKQVASEDMAAACEWLTYGVPYVDRRQTLGFHDAVFEVMVQGIRLGAVWIAIQPGRTATLQGPRVEGCRADSVRNRLMQCVEEFLKEHDILVVQFLLTDDQTEIPDGLAEYGFQHVVEIDFLARSLPRDGDARSSDRSADVRDRRGVLEACTNTTGDRLATVVEATYQQTMDCPALDHSRRLEDILTGYRAIGEPSTDAWKIFCYEGRDIGCLLMADHPDLDECEIVYMGIVPEYRGRGFGQDLTCEAIRWSVARGRSYLRVAVDTANRPALAMYRAAEFFHWDQRRVALRLRLSTDRSQDHCEPNIFSTTCRGGRS